MLAYVIGKPGVPGAARQSNGSAPSALDDAKPPATNRTKAACSPRLPKSYCVIPERAIDGRAGNRRQYNRQSLRNPPIRSRSALRKASVEPRPNSETPNNRATKCAGGEFGGDSERFETARPVVRFRSIEARDQADAGIGQWRGDFANVTGRHADIAVVDDQNRDVALREQDRSAMPTFGSARRCAHKTSRMGKRRELAHQPLYFDARRIVCAPDAEQDLELRILLQRVCADGFVESRRLCRTPVSGSKREAAGALAVGFWRICEQYRDNGQQLIQAGGDRQDDDCDGHIASSATPQATESAPAQRRAVTFSRSTNRARTVSSATLAAVAGTAKLRSATDKQLHKGEERDRHEENSQHQRTALARG